MNSVFDLIFTLEPPDLLIDAPVIMVTGAQFSTKMIAAISTRGHLMLMVQQGAVIADVFCDFLDRPMQRAKNAIFMIWHGYSKHRSRKVRECIELDNGKLEVCFLPSYSHELETT